MERCQHVIRWCDQLTTEINKNILCQDSSLCCHPDHSKELLRTFWLLICFYVDKMNYLCWILLTHGPQNLLG